MAGYSGTPLGKKLGVKPGIRMYVRGAPDGYFDWLHPLPSDVAIAERLTGQFDLIHLFAAEEKTFRTGMTKSKRFLKPDGMLWISWPKKSSGMVSDLDENRIRDFGLAQGLVDVKVCAVDDTWSGLKFVIPVRLRK